MPAVIRTSTSSASYRSRSYSRSAYITLPLYLFSLVAAFLLCALSIHALIDYAHPSGSIDQHDELFRFSPCSHPHTHSTSLDNPQNTHSLLASRSWNGLANALGGFSTSFVHAPAVNASWISRPAGFGPRIVNDAGLKGVLKPWSAFSKSGESDIDCGETELDEQYGNKACSPIGSFASLLTPGRSKSGDGDEEEVEEKPQIALVQRGDCPFIQKLLNAQAANASAVIVYNDAAHASSSRPNGRLSGNRGLFDTLEEDELISMWSPTRESSKLFIPSVFVSYNTGQALLRLLSSPHPESSGILEIVLEPEEPPHLFLMDIIILMLFAPSLFTTVIVVITKIRQIRRRAKQRAPQSLVDTLPSFRWRENLQIADLEKDLECALPLVGEDAGIEGSGPDKRSQSKVLSFIQSRLRKSPVGTPASSAEPSSSAISAAPSTSMGTNKARNLAKKIFSQKECAICLADFVTNDTVRLLPCGHVFHMAEIDSWLTQQKRWCPVCRCSIDDNEDSTASTTLPSSSNSNLHRPTSYGTITAPPTTSAASQYHPLPASVDPQPILPTSLLLATGDDSDDEEQGSRQIAPVAGSSNTAATRR